jgi:hypothetical protein
MCFVRKVNARGDFEELFIYLKALSKKESTSFGLITPAKDSVKRLRDLLLDKIQFKKEYKESWASVSC